MRSNTHQVGRTLPTIHGKSALNGGGQIYDAALKECGGIPGKLVKEILEGPPAKAILSVMGTRQVDLIVMGTRGLGRIASLVLGSQSMKVISQGNCPVLLIR